MRLATLLLVAAFTPVMLPAHADAKSDAILKAAFTKIHAARSMTADISATMQVPAMAGMGRGAITLRGTVAAMKPNYLRVELSTPARAANSIYFASNGKTYYTNFGTPPNTYQEQPVLTHPTDFGGVWEGEIDSFFGGPANLAKAKTSYGGTEKVGGIECDIVKAQMSSPDRTVVYAVGRTDHLIHRTQITASGEGGAQRMTDTLTNIRFDVPLKPDRFTFKPPAGSHPAQPQPPSGDGTFI